MKKKLSVLSAMITGVVSGAVSALDKHSELQSVDQEWGLDEVEVGVLNAKLPLYLAAHSSHSSHRSHGSHRSSSGGGYTPSTPKVTPRSEPLGQPAKPAGSTPTYSQNSRYKAAMDDVIKRKNIIMRVQLTLESLGYYKGAIDGLMGPNTRKALNRYRAVKGLKVHEKLDVETLNYMGIQAY